MDRWRHPNHRPPSELPQALRRVGVPAPVRWWISRCTGSPVAAVHRMDGASSTAVHEVRLADGSIVVLRRYVWREFTIDEPHAPTREAEALAYVRRHGLTVPSIIAADPRGADIGDGVPALLMTRVKGRAQPSPNVDELAALAAQIHAISGLGFDHHYAPWCRNTSTVPPPGCRRPELWARALELWRSAEPPYDPCFVHRDLHPGNVLWSRGRLTGLVDWVNACRGPRGIDVATCRWNLQEWAGESAATSFVARYESLTGSSHHPYWDVAKIVEDDWDRVERIEQVWDAENLLAQAMPRLLATM